MFSNKTNEKTGEMAIFHEFKEEISVITKETLATMTVAEVAQFVTELMNQKDAAVANEKTAIWGYDAAVKDRDAKIQAVKDDLNMQLAEIASKADALKPDMLNASIAGDSALMDKVRRKLSALEGQRSELNAQLELMSGKPPRCDEAYAAVEAAVAKSEEAERQFKSDRDVIDDFCKEMVTQWKEISSMIWAPRSFVLKEDIERVRKRYSSEQ